MYCCGGPPHRAACLRVLFHLTMPLVFCCAAPFALPADIRMHGVVMRLLRALLTQHRCLSCSSANSVTPPPAASDCCISWAIGWELG